jgi:hypothetical protein
MSFSGARDIDPTSKEEKEISAERGFIKDVEMSV